MSYSSSDKIKIARVIAGALGVEDTETKSSPETLIDLALRKSKHSALHKDSISIILSMLKTATEAGIKFDPKLAPTSIKESEEDADEDEDEDEDEEEGHTPERDEEEAKMEAEIDALDDEDFEDLMSTINELEDVVDFYQDDELHVVDDENNHVSDLSDLQGIKEAIEPLNEIMTRGERIKAAIRFKQSSGKRQRKMKIALHKRSTTSQMNTRARAAAIRGMKERIAKKPLSQMTVQDKIRVERIVAKKKKVIGRLAMRLVPRLRKIEATRIHPKTTN